MKTARAALAADVSRETLNRLDAYVALLTKWNKAISLVGPSTLADIWSRHILDSAQLIDLAPAGGNWLDIGSGGGLPGLVVAIVLHERQPAARVTLIESDRRKAAFLRNAAAELGLAVEILAARAEQAAPVGADIVTARALAPLDRLLDVAVPHLKPGGICLFPKGRNHGEEIRAAQAKWQFQCTAIPSRTSAEAVILRLQEPTIV